MTTPPTTHPSQCAAVIASAQTPGPARKSRAVSGARTAKSNYDGSFANRSEITQQVAGVSLVHSLRSGGKVTARAGRAWDISDDFVDTTFTGDFETQRDSASVQVDLPLASAQVLTLGLDYQDDEVSGSTDYEVSSRNDVGLFAQYVATTGPWRFEGSLRGDDNEQFGEHLTSGLGVGYQVSPGWGLVAQYGTAFRAPTFNELYYPFFGNPALEPEESQSAELAARGHTGSMRWRVSLFDNEIDDLIGFDANFAPANIDEARILGVEAGVTMAVHGWTIDAGLTLLDPENRSAGPNEGNQLPRRPETTGRLDVERRFEKFTLGARVAGSGSSYDDAANSETRTGLRRPGPSRRISAGFGLAPARRGSPTCSTASTKRLRSTTSRDAPRISRCATGNKLLVVVARRVHAFRNWPARTQFIRVRRQAGEGLLRRTG